MKKTILLLVLIVSISTVFAQEKINFHDINTKTYDQYLKKQWSELIETAKLSLKNDIDFYYLRVRLGIAYYELKKYNLAIEHFEKAFKENRKDEIVLEYLYYTYIFSGNYADARTIIPFMSDEMIKRLKIVSPPFIYSLYFDTKHDINENYIIEPEPFQTVEQITVLNQSYYNFSLEHIFGRRVRIFHGYTRLQLSNEIQTAPESSLPARYREDVKQNQYFFSLGVHIAKQTDITGTIHFLNTNYAAIDPMATWGRRSNYFYYIDEGSMAASIMISKKHPYFFSSLGSSFSTLNNNIQFQPEINFNIIPFGKNRLYLKSKFIYHIEYKNFLYSYEPVFIEGIGVNISKNFYFETSATIGRLKNFTEYNAIVANNDSDPITGRYEALLAVSTNKKNFNFFLKYSYNTKENEYKINSVINTQNYINQSITGGIQWYF